MKYFIKHNVHRIILVISAIFCGLIQSLINFYPVAFIAYSPLFYYLLKQKRDEKAWAILSWFFLPYYFTQVSFMLKLYAMLDLPILLGILLSMVATTLITLWLSLIMLVALIPFEKLRRRKPVDILTLSLLIILGEWLSENIPVLSFPWSAVWQSAVYFTPFIQSASLLGGRFISLIILIINGLFACAFLYSGRFIKARFSLTAIILLIIPLAYGEISMSMSKAEKQHTITTTIVQGDFLGKEKRCANPSAAWETYKALILEHGKSTDLFVLSETAIPRCYSCDDVIFKDIADTAKSLESTIITGCFWEENGKTYNALYTADSTPYFKKILVPFGEKMPFADFLGVSTITSADTHEMSQPLESDVGTIGCAICIESVYSSVARRQTSAGGEILCISTNDSWFAGTFARQAHLRHSVMRSVECSRYVIRSANCGISAVINEHGQIIAENKSYETGSITADVNTIEYKNMYTYIGDIIILFPVLMYISVLMKLIKKPRNRLKNPV